MAVSTNLGLIQPGMEHLRSAGSGGCCSRNCVVIIAAGGLYVRAGAGVAEKGNHTGKQQIKITTFFSEAYTVTKKAGHGRIIQL